MKGEHKKCKWSRGPLLKVLLIICILFLNIRTQAQTDSAKKTFTVSGYAEGYYSYDFTEPPDKLKPPFLYSFNRHNEPNFNLLMLKGNFQTAMFRANAAFMAGTYSRYNLAQEPDILRNIYELNFGVRLGKKAIWFDAGVMPSHLGFESAVGKDCWNLTRSMMAENSPYYETGLKLGYDSDNSKWYAAVLFLVGWQRMKPVEQNSLPSFGTQVQYKPNAKLLLNSSSFIGTDKPDSARKMRYYHDLYAVFQVNAKLGLQAAFDIGAEQEAKGSSSYNFWYTWVLGMRYNWNKRIATGFRLEYYQDKNGVIVSTETGEEMNVFGASANLDVQIFKKLLWRTEYRSFTGKGEQFVKNGDPVQGNQAVTTSLAFYF